MTPGRTTVFRAARVFDGEAFLRGPHDVTVSDGVINSVAPTGPQAPGADVHVVDCAGRTLLPGLIDAHVHMMMSGDPTAVALRPYSQAYYESVANARTVLSCGVTTVRDCGGADLGMKRAVDGGIVPGPRMKIATSIISQTGGHGDYRLPSGYTFGMVAEHEGLPHAVVDGVDEARKIARTLIRAGADHLKICTSGGVMSPTDNPHHPQFSYDEIRVIVEEAEAVDSYVLSHAIGATGIRNAVCAGVRSIEHGIFADPETLDMMAERGVFLVPTMTAPRGLLKKAESGAYVPEYMVTKARAVADRHLAAVGRAHRAGVKIAMGSDSGINPHGRHLEELSLMAEAGMSLEQALSAGTKVAAELLRETGALGEIKDGCVADLVLLDLELSRTDQLASLAERVGGVWKGGQAV
ncbi:amidohydrolase family protein [Streptomyces sp. NPDC090493]|uniref:metal-dependent hydrolase family protein n=1 Tax=Streptomyces sp. NPDC090493 TaxID=3365964 RepID=UPI0037FD8DEE